MSAAKRYVIALGILLAARAGATTITTTNFSTWESSSYTTSGSQFELNFSPVGSNSYNTSAGITLYGTQNASVAFQFTGPDNGAYILSGTTYGPRQITALAGASDGVGVINVAAPSGGENAIFLGIGSTGNTPLTLLLSDGESFTGLSPGLFGLSISHAISWVSLSTSSGSKPVIDDFWYGTSSLAQDAPPAAEAATFLLIGGGLLILFGAKRKLRSN